MKCVDHIPKTEKLPYNEWHEKAEEARKRGERQARCNECFCFFFPWERIT